METNPFQSPTHIDRPRSSWKFLWKRFCLVSLGTAVILLTIGKLVAASARSRTDERWFLILDGLLALGELLSWTMAGVGGIGWIVCRRTPVINCADPGSGPAA